MCVTLQGLKHQLEPGGGGGISHIYLGRASALVSLQYWAGNKQIVRVMMETGQVNLKSRA